MKHYSPKPLLIVLHPSYLLACVLAMAGTGACGVLAALPAPLWIRLLLATVVAAAACYHIAADALRCLPWSIAALETRDGSTLVCRLRSGLECAAEVQRDSYVTAWLTVVNLRLPSMKRRRAVVLLPDAAEADAYRRLRVWLKWRRPT